MACRVSLLSGFLALVVIGGSPVVQGQQPAGVGQERSVAVEGRSQTQLSDGRWLIVGGRQGKEVLNTIAIYDPATQRAITLPARLTLARAWHSSTVLEDGTVLLAGGEGAGGEALAGAERFDPATQTTTPIALDQPAPRSRRSATLLPDGRVLVVGGVGALATLADAEIWDVDQGPVRPIAGASPRAGHTAALQADGTVWLTGGTNGTAASKMGQVFDPQTQQFRQIPVPRTEVTPFVLAESSPAPNAQDVAIETVIMLRVSAAADVVSVRDSIALVDDSGTAVPTNVVVAEQGRLIFLHPLGSLLPEHNYQVRIDGLRSSEDAAILTDRLKFRTLNLIHTPTEDGAVWVPDGVVPGEPWRTNYPPSPFQHLPTLQAAPGMTALAGQVLLINGNPLRQVTLEIEGHEAETDATGRFLLPLPDVAAGRHILEIKGSTANRGQRHYAFFEYTLKIDRGMTNILPFTIWMPQLDTAHEVTIASPTMAETVITTPYIRGLELHLPAGTTIRGEEGDTETRLGITPIPIDRPPFPLPKNVNVPVYFTVQPGGAYVSTPGPGPRGGWLVYPNYKGGMPGERIQFFHYDPDERDWYVYGAGSVTSNGEQVMPDKSTRIYEFTGAMINYGQSPPPAGATPGEGKEADPVDPSTGIFVMHKTDLYVADIIPIEITRTYQSGDNLMRPFGRGMTHPYAMLLWSALQYREAD